MAMMLRVLFVAVMVACYTPLANPQSRPEDRVQNSTGPTGYGLTLTVASPNRIKGQYFGRAGGGISFDVDTREGHHSLTIDTLEDGGGRILTARQHFLRESTPLSVSLLDKHFLVSKDKDGSRRKEYLVPQPFRRYFGHDLKHDKLFHHLKKHLHERGVNETRSAAIGQFLASNEATLVVQVAVALGERGFIGRENPAAMMFYILASRVQNSAEDKKEDGSTQDNHSKGGHRILKRTARGAASQSEEFCKNVQHPCPSGRCPEGSECTGLCGMSCNCWEWVCGNCCLNKMCLDHDNYCADGLLTWCCMGILEKDINIDIDCDKPYTCPE